MPLEEEREPDITPERLDQLRSAYDRCRQQKRGGDNNRRRLKGLCCGLLRFLIQLCTSVINNSQSWQEQRPYRLRRQQARERLRSVILGNLPRRDEELLGPWESQELESELGDQVVISESEAEDTSPGDLRGVWANVHPSTHQSSIASASSSGGQAASSSSGLGAKPKVKVTRENSLIRSPASTGHFDRNLLADNGVIFVPENRTELLQGFVISLDWHQVLDVIRRSQAEGGNLRVRDNCDYYLLEEVKQKIEQTVDRIQQEINREVAYRQFDSTDIHCIVLSYTHNEVYKNRVLALRESTLDLAITTKAREGVGGKLWTLSQICHPSARVIHFDDNPEVLREIQHHWETPLARPFIHPLGIVAPRKKRVTDVAYRKNVLKGLESANFF